MRADCEVSGFGLRVSGSLNRSAKINLGKPETPNSKPETGKVFAAFPQPTV